MFDSHLKTPAADVKRVESAPKTKQYRLKRAGTAHIFLLGYGSKDSNYRQVKYMGFRKPHTHRQYKQLLNCHNECVVGDSAATSGTTL